MSLAWCKAILKQKHCPIQNVVLGEAQQSDHGLTIMGRLGQSVSHMFEFDYGDKELDELKPCWEVVYSVGPVELIQEVIGPITHMSFRRQPDRISMWVGRLHWAFLYTQALGQIYIISYIFFLQYTSIQVLIYIIFDKIHY